MPKKSSNNNIRHVHREHQQKQEKVSSSAEKPGQIIKRYRSLHVGIKNGRRWISLKKRLNFYTDDDLFTYLLDLADSIKGRGSKCNETDSNWKTDQDKENNVDRKTAVATEPEEPLRRSPRKFCNSKEAVLEAAEIVTKVRDDKNINELSLTKHSLKTKKHKYKGKHHKDKRKRKKREKNDNGNNEIELAERDVVSDGEIKKRENNYNNLTGEEPNDSKHQEKVFNSLIDNNINNQHLQTNEACTIISKSFNEVSVNCAELDAYVEQGKDIYGSASNLDISNENLMQHQLNAKKLQISNLLDLKEVEEKRSLEDNQNISKQIQNFSQVQDEEESRHNYYSIENFLKEDNNINNIQNDAQDDQKHKKKKKRSRQENDVENPTELNSDAKIMHRKKRHKHNDGHSIKIKKHHDVRKAPQNGIVALNSDPIENGNCTNDESSNFHDTLSSSEAVVEAPISEVQRVAIKIKLCQDCNARHLQDACPLTKSQCIIYDSITHTEWLNKYKKVDEIMQIINNNDPMLEGYPKQQNDDFESDDEANNCSNEQQTKSNVKNNRVDSEEKQLIIDVNKPLYARDSLPDYLEFKATDTEHGIGVFAKTNIPSFAKLGPLIGKPIKEMDIPDDFSMRHIWEVSSSGKVGYISTANPLTSNWIRYVRPAESKEERNVTVVNKNGELILVANKDIAPGTEMTYWADSALTTWTRKNKTDKTNCGGCNLNFLHPIYYRLHCCIFHDTNYSLTIRKYHCKVCGAAVLGKDNIMKHAAELHGGRGAYQCQYCKKFFLRLNYLEMHRTYGCSQNPQRSRPLCDFCGRKFCQPQKLKVHIKRMHSDMSEVLKEFQCKSCLKLLGSRAALQRHMKEVHHKDVVGAATCDRCGKMFQNKSNLKIHMLTHSGVKPFKCREKDCKAAFTTKQCLQFHYKKVHGISEDHMPKIERSVAYTFDAYSGGLIEENDVEKKQKNSRRNSQENNSNGLVSIDDCSSENSVSGDVAIENVSEADNFDSNSKEKVDENLTEESSRKICISPAPSLSTPCQPTPSAPVSSMNSPVSESMNTDGDLYTTTRFSAKNGCKKWLMEFSNQHSPQAINSNITQQIPSTTSDIYEFQDNTRKDEEKLLSLAQTRTLIDDTKLGMGMYRRTESASLLVQAALDAAERDIGSVSSPTLEETDRDANFYSITNHLDSSPIQRSPDAHLESYIQQQESELVSPAQTPIERHSPPPHMHVDYHIHRPIDYVNPGIITRSHSIEQYLDHQDIQRVVASSPTSYIHVPQDELSSPSGTPNRYQDSLHHHHHHLHHHHHQLPTDNNISSDEGEGVVQNLSLSVKEKTLQLDLSTSYKYDTLDTDFCRERSNNFEPLILNSGDLHGLDMSANSRYHHHLDMSTNSRYHHHLYDITERQSVDLSRSSTTYPMSPPPPPPPYPSHNDVLRVVSLDLTPGGRHSVDLSFPRSHHLHTSSTARLISSPPPSNPSNASHMIPDLIEGPPVPSYNSAYSVGAPYHPSRTAYHHYSGYY